ncbi:hypothetical protein A2738_01900 [Candidatus Nomurabacteria bacterium RIFCSPHIGHO2_01_FULL_42_15]|uniref:Baseplate protein J-like domain-containing protein n=1 Tax=Candidatus Nomurabacteria bacterium RIFCSPHIGHO2_01_FULL_42_15 TaxID=1801742 RepID=A0A1F6VG77_9BACT|nr:MAG: hypothetical protein A2738_01900 [Candidatus Nomurabacteria bacterium RIFCSPHIGHO2_01_FULL_42_15]OGI92962.1 MAG: hypothetical protein A3A99_00270 [Candidatus Nomurabacteria bacterium RIFCSPLOWO2_01_FULL_41_18]
MQKNLLQDMVRIKRARQGVQAAPEVEVRPEPPERPKKVLPIFTTKYRAREATDPEKPGSKYKLWLVAGVSIIFFLFSISYIFINATVTVNPKIENLVLNENMTASLDGGTEALPFDLIVISGEENKTLQSSGEKDVLEKARGVVLIYNNFSTASQRLDIDTRLEGSNGKIYKTEKQVIVGGIKGGIPGSVEVGIYGAQEGEEYNSGPLDFTILGFKGTPKYSKFYARSEGEITGGFKGKAPIISSAEKSVAVSEMKTTLETKLFERASDQIPEGFILFKDAVFLDINENDIDSTPVKDDLISFVLKGTLYGFLLEESRLAEEIAGRRVAGYDGSAVYIPNIRDLVLSLSNKENISGEVKNIQFNLKGDANIVSKLDEDKLIADLIGKSKKDFNQILLEYPNIISAKLTLRPFWKRSFPDEAKDIKVIVNYPQ